MKKIKIKNMKKLLLICFFSCITLSSFSQLFVSKEKRAIINEIHQHIKGIVSTASYNKKATEVYNATYVVATKNYNQIVKDSEKKGYIDAKQEDDLKKEFLTIELRGDEPPYKVSFQVKREVRTKDILTGVYSAWTSGSVDAQITKLQTEVYETLNGSIELPKDLLEKIEKFNSGETKDRKKILKGIDY